MAANTFLICSELFLDIPLLPGFFPALDGFTASAMVVKFGWYFIVRYHLTNFSTLSILIVSAKVCEHNFIDLNDKHCSSQVNPHFPTFTKWGRLPLKLLTIHAQLSESPGARTIAASSLTTLFAFSQRAVFS